MARTSPWYCQNPDCRDPETGRSQVLGEVFNVWSLSIGLDVEEWRIDLRSSAVHIVCPRCGSERTFKGIAVHRRPTGNRAA